MKLTCHKDVITENAANKLIKLNCLLAKLSRSHRYWDTLKLFQQIQSSHHLRPDHYTLSSAISASANLHVVVLGDQLHGHAIRAGLKTFPHVANTLLSLYAKSHDLASVKRVFTEIEIPDVYSWTTMLSACTKLGEADYACHLLDEMPHRNMAVWNAVITGCAQNGDAEIAFHFFRRMHLLGVRHDNYTFACVLSLCFPDLFDLGREVHSLLIKTGYLIKASVINALLTMYFNCASVSDAYRVFEEAKHQVRDQITYNAMIAGLVSAGRDKESFIMFKGMQDACFRPTHLTFVSVMSSCSCGRVAIQVHAQAIKMGFDNCTSVSNAAITMYSNCGDLDSIHLVFERLEYKDTVSWNTIITSYAEGNFGSEAILAYLQMQREGHAPDQFTIGSLLVSTESLATVETIQSLVLKSGLISNVQVFNALLSAFFKHGEIKLAYHAFEEMCYRNLISWNSMISGLHVNGFPLQGLEQFSELILAGLMPNIYTLSIVLSICSGFSSLRHGKQVHGYIIKYGYFSETSISNALMTLYSKCGVLDWSLRIFERMVEKDNVSWNSMISAYAQHGKGKEAVYCFEAMQELDAVKPDKVTFTAVLSACSHSGLVDDGTRIFKSMVNKYGFEPGVDHFSCIVDLLGRAGYLDAAERLITSNLIDIDSSIWWTLFSSCAAHGDLRLGRIVAGFVLETEHNNPAVYVLLSNTYANVGQWEEAANVRNMMKSIGVIKEPGCSWIRS